MTGPLVRVIARGALSLVQDRGRHGYQRYGVSVSGATDQEALLLGNRLLGNSPDAAALEVTVGGAEFEFLHDAVVAVTGADLSATIGDDPVPMWQSFFACEGLRLRFAMPARGIRAYLCVGGGIATEPVLGSRATHAASHLGGLSGGRLESGDELPAGETSTGSTPGLSLPVGLRPEYPESLTVHVIPGPQNDVFAGAGTATLFGSQYIVTDRSDRQGLRLDGPVIESKTGRYDIVSDAVVAGSVQVPGDGKPIILMADRQTTGGYAKIGVVASVDLPALAQASPGVQVRFVRWTVAEAQKAARARMTALIRTPLEMRGDGPEFRIKTGPRRITVRFATGIAGSQKNIALAVDKGPLVVSIERVG